MDPPATMQLFLRLPRSFLFGSNSNRNIEDSPILNGWIGACAEPKQEMGTKLGTPDLPFLEELDLFETQ